MSPPVNALERLLRDADLHWAGTDIGLFPSIAPHVAEQIDAAGSALIPSLVDALSSEPDFAAAHVLLTRVSGVEYESMPAWNGLAVEIGPDNRVEIDPDQRLQLARRWRLWLAATPHPRRLPKVG